MIDVFNISYICHIICVYLDHSSILSMIQLYPYNKLLKKLYILRRYFMDNSIRHMLENSYSYLKLNMNINDIIKDKSYFGLQNNIPTLFLISYNNKTIIITKHRNNSWKINSSKNISFVNSNYLSNSNNYLKEILFNILSQKKFKTYKLICDNNCNCYQIEKSNRFNLLF